MAFKCTKTCVNSYIVNIYEQTNMVASFFGPYYIIVCITTCKIIAPDSKVQQHFLSLSSHDIQQVNVN